MKSNQLIKVKGLFDLIESKYEPSTKFMYYTPSMLNFMLETFMRFQMADHVAQILKYFLSKETYPKKSLLKTLGRMNYLTDEIYYLLDEFNFKSERVKSKTRSFSENDKNPINEKPKELIKDMLRNQKQYKNISF